MKKYYIFVLLLTCILFVSCSNYWTFVNHSYKELKPQGTSILVILKDSIHLDYGGSVKEEFGEGDSIELITNFLLKTIKNEFTVNPAFRSVDTKICRNCKGLVEVSLPYFGAKNSIEMHLPDYTKSTSYESDEISYILFLEEFHIYSKFKLVNVSVGMIPIAFPQKPLKYDAKFALWDNKDKNLVAWGRVMAADTAAAAITMVEWKSVTYKFCDNLLNETPFNNFGNKRYRVKEITLPINSVDNKIR